MTLDVAAAVAAEARCEDENRLVGPNPRFWDWALSGGAVQLIVVSTADPTRKHSQESDDQLRVRANVWNALDLDALARVLR